MLGEVPSVAMSSDLKRLRGASRSRFVLLVATALIVAACSSSDDDSSAETDPGADVDVDAPADPTTTPAPAGTTEVPDDPATPAGSADVPNDPPAADVPPIVDQLRRAGSDVALFSGAGALTTFVAPNLATDHDDPGSAVFAYLEQFGETYGVAEPASRFEIIRTEDTSLGTVVRLVQTLDGLPVFAGEVAVTVSPEGEIVSVAGVVAPDAIVAEPTLTGVEAVAAATEAAGGVAAAEPELVVYSPAVVAAAIDPPLPAWTVRVLVDDGGATLEDVVVISAVDGAVLLRAGIDATEQNWDLSDAENAVNDDGDGTVADATPIYEMRDGTRTELASPDTDAVLAADNLSASWNYFMDTHGRDGHDGEGGSCDVFVHVGVDWRNASATGNCVIRFGDAEPYAQSLDVMVHEFTHAVAAQTAGLLYADQSGAISEHYADFFAVMVDRSDWVIDIVDRDLSAPAVDRFSEFVSTSGDYGGVHTNSGIGNHAGYLVAADGTNTHADTGVAVEGIGRAKAESLWYATLQSLSPLVGYPAWACATVSTARGMDDLDDDDVQSVVDAMKAVELIEQADGAEPVCLYSITGSPTTPTPSTTEPGAPELDCQLADLWRLQDQQFLDEIARVTGEAGVQLEYYAGDYLLRIDADGSVVSERQNWSLRAASPAGAVVIVISGSETGTWNAADSTLSIESDGGAAEVSLFLEIDGALTPVPFGVEVPVDIEAVTGTGSFECDGDLLTVTITTEEGPFVTTWDRANAGVEGVTS